MDLVAGAHGGVGSRTGAVDVADDVGVGVVAGGDEAIVNGACGPADAVGLVDLVRAGVEAVVELAVDDDVGEVGVAEDGGDEG